MTPAGWWVAALVGAAALCWPVRAAPRWRRIASLPAAPARVSSCSPVCGRGPSGGTAAPTSELLLSLVGMVASQVRAGAEPLAAWRAAVELEPLARRAGAGDEPLAWWDAVARSAMPKNGGAAPLLAGFGRRAGASGQAAPAVREAAAALAAGWRLAQQTGAPLADVLDAVAGGLRQEAAVAADAEAALAGPRATARLLAGLPLAGIGLGELMGAHPLHVLLGTSPGRTCLLAGVALSLVGRLWMRRLVDAAVAVG